MCRFNARELAVVQPLLGRNLALLDAEPPARLEFPFEVGVLVVAGKKLRGPLPNKKPNHSKDETYFKVLNAALELDVKKGHLKWSLSDLSRKSAVTRSLIYYYFGRSKMDILSSAVRLIGEEVVGLTKERVNMWEQGDFVRSTLGARGITNKAPYLSQFILEHRMSDNPLGESLRKTELEFIAKISRFFPRCSEAEVKALFAMYWGLLFASHVDDAVIQSAVSAFRRLFA